MAISCDFKVMFSAMLNCVVIGVMSRSFSRLYFELFRQVFSMLSQVYFLKVEFSQRIDIVTVKEECEVYEYPISFSVPCVLLCCAMFILYILPVLVLVVRRANVLRDVCPVFRGTEDYVSKITRSELHQTMTFSVQVHKSTNVSLFGGVFAFGVLQGSKKF